MGLLKSANPTTATLAPFSMGDVEAHARSLIAQAKRRAADLLAAAEAEAESMRASAVEEGHAAGFERGMAEAESRTAAAEAAGRDAGEAAAVAEHGPRLVEVVASLAALAGEVDGARESLAVDARADLLRLAVAIARRVVRRLGESDPSVAEGAIADAVRLAVEKTDLRLAVHPSTRATAEAYLPKLRLAWPAMKHVAVTDDASLAPGGCRVLTAAGGSIDADLDAQIDRIAADLIEADPMPQEGGRTRRGDVGE